MASRLPSAQIESFMVLARELNFSRAAEVLHITQPALTKRIQNLEETLGQVLFLRLRGGLELTESGRILQRYAASIEHQEQEVLDSASSVTSTPKAASPASFASALSPRRCARSSCRRSAYCCARIRA